MLSTSLNLQLRQPMLPTTPEPLHLTMATSSSSWPGASWDFEVFKNQLTPFLLTKNMKCETAAMMALSYAIRAGTIITFHENGTITYSEETEERLTKCGDLVKKLVGLRTTGTNNYSPHLFPFR
jgi:hypothetical protein